MAAWAIVKMVTAPSAWFLDAATRRALAIAAHSALAPAGVAFPGIALLPGDRVASCAILQAGAVCEVGQSRSARKLCFSHGCGFFFYGGGGCLKRGCNLKYSRTVSSLPLAEHVVRGSDEFPGLVAPRILLLMASGFAL